MNDLRLWIAILAVVTFHLGLGVGVYLSARLHATTAPAGPFAAYETRLTEEFALSGERRALLRVVLDGYARDLEEIKDRHLADYMSAMEPELRERGRYYRDLIHGKVLPESQRERFARLVAQAEPPRD